ncbi:hypothetical protein [Coralliovum pocilloporae]|uniref:hypothetical protein n=1 Tax=Coralliovum pocilloporae TaxID=3066369 RepID=UPI0033077708
MGQYSEGAARTENGHAAEQDESGRQTAGEPSPIDEGRFHPKPSVENWSEAVRRQLL